MSPERRKIHNRLVTELWRTWKLSGERPLDLEPIKSAFSSLIQERMELFEIAKVRVNKVALRTRLERALVDALRSFNPGSSQSLSAWVTTELLKVHDRPKTEKRTA